MLHPRLAQPFFRDFPHGGAWTTHLGVTGGLNFGSLGDATGLDLCARTDLTPLAGFNLEVTERKVPALRSGPACFWEMRTPDGRTANLTVRATTFPSVAEAVRFHGQAHGSAGMTPDGEIDGVGDSATGFTRRRDIGYSFDEYLVTVQTGNLVTTVWIALGAEKLTPKQTLSSRTIEITLKLVAMIPRR